MKRLILTLLLVVCVVFGAPAKAHAHSMWADYSVGSGAQVEITAVFSSGEIFANAPVTIYAPNNPDTPWQQGTTDAQGRIAIQFDESIPGDWKVRVGQADHADILTFPVNAEGIEADQISDRPHPSDPGRNQFVVLGFAAVFGLVGTRLFSSLKNHWAD